MFSGEAGDLQDTSWEILSTVTIFSAYSTFLFLSLLLLQQSFVNKDIPHMRKAQKFPQIHSENFK